ncbi:MAG: hypothetical protein ABS46_12460 [Cytophagaceae bacterium SCN 52-12]|nr:MAG: hypothetical protein ABS46_12460 [Cytophagaceae bacterium SCN 52-12]
MSGKEAVWSDFRRGSRAAYETLIRDYYQDLHVYGMRLLNNPDFIKDCIHDLFIHIWERRSYLGETDDVRLYLLKSLRNRVIKGINRSNKWLEFGEDSVSGTDPEWSVEDKIISTEKSQFERQRIRAILLGLSPRQREVIHLRFFEGLSNERIAGIMEISKPAVANLVHAALGSMRLTWHSSVISVLLFIGSLLC